MSDSSVETATIVFTDLVGSTEMRSALGDEMADRLRRVHDVLVTDGITAFDGQVVKSLGDGYMAVFASASDALNAAVAIQQAFSRRNRSAPADPPMHVRVGVAAGDIVREGGDRHGLPVVQAARLCDRCQAGEILTTAIVKLLAGSRFDVETVDLGPVELKGLAGPVETLRVDWPTVAADRGTPPLQSFLSAEQPTELCGRIDEMATARNAWKRTVAGAASVVLVSGEPGVGKTRLLTELAREASEGGAVVLAGRIEEGLGGPYQPFVEALVHYVRFHAEGSGSPDLGDSPGELTRIVPDLTEIVGPLPPPIRADPGTEQYRLAAAITSWIQAVAARQPVMLVIDDFHWAEPQTAILIRHLCTELTSSPVMVAVTYRDTDLSANPAVAGVIADLHRLPRVSAIALKGLDAEALRRLIVSIGVMSASLDALATMIHQHSEGNPFLAGELVRHLDDAALDSGGVVSMPPLPSTIAEVLRRRVGRLRRETAEMLATAAVIGREFSLERLTAVMGDERDLIELADEALDAKLLEERGVGRYRFVHQLVVESLLQGLSATRRADVHLRVANAIERENAANLDAVLGELAYHYSAAAPRADTGRAVDIIARAGHQAVDQLAFSEAVDYFSRAIEIGGGLEPTIRADLYIALARAQSHAGHDPEPAAGEAAAIARELGDHERLAHAALAKELAVLGLFGQVDTGRTGLLEDAIEHSEDLSLSVRARLHAELALELMFGDTDRKLAEANRALDLAQRSGSPETLGRVLALRYPTLWTARTHDARLHLVEDLEAIATELNDQYLGFLAAANGTLVMLEAGELDAALARLEHAHELAQTLGEPRLRWFASVCRAKAQIIEGRLDEAEATAAEGAALAQRAGRADYMSYRAAQAFCIGFHRQTLHGLEGDVDAAVERNPAVPAFRALRVALNAELGRPDAAHAELQALAATEFEFPPDFTQVVALCFTALGAAASGDAENAEALSALLRPHSGRYADAGSTWYGAVDHYLGALAAVSGDRVGAVDHYRSALRLHHRVRSGPMIARTEAALAALRNSAT